jgi:halimadienyl-diphosphate synthase
MIDINEQAVKLLNTIDEGFMPGLAYDTAWAAMVPESSGSTKPLFPKSMLWLITAQRQDGSWGAEFEYFYDRLVSTLGSIIALKKTFKAEKFQKLIELGEDYIWYNIKQLQTEPQQTVGFELIFPSLMAEAEVLGLNLPYREKFYEPLKDKKLKLAIGELIASENSTVTYSLEFLGDLISKNILLQIQNVNGSISNSPSATAFMLTKLYNERAYNYLNRVLDFNGGSAMTLFPFDVFETAWVIEYFLKSGIPIENHILSKIEALYKLWSEKGISMSRIYYSEDLDDTTTVFNILQKTNHDVNIKVIEHYESDSHFNCYPSELSPSPQVNIKVLNVLKNNKNYSRREEVIEKILKFLSQERHQNSFWLDKWNISPYYCTGLALEAVGDFDNSLSGDALDWIIKTQNYDGSWGQRNGSMEESAYALLALMNYHMNIEKIDTSIIANGLKYLENNYNTDFYPELWIGKGLYCPYNVAKACVLSALYLGKTNKFDSDKDND